MENNKYISHPLAPKSIVKFRHFSDEMATPVGQIRYCKYTKDYLCHGELELRWDPEASDGKN